MIVYGYNLIEKSSGNVIATEKFKRREKNRQIEVKLYFNDESLKGCYRSSFEFRCTTPPRNYSKC